MVKSPRDVFPDPYPGAPDSQREIDRSRNPTGSMPSASLRRTGGAIAATTSPSGFERPGAVHRGAVVREGGGVGAERQRRDQVPIQGTCHRRGRAGRSDHEPGRPHLEAHRPRRAARRQLVRAVRSGRLRDLDLQRVRVQRSHRVAAQQHAIRALDDERAERRDVPGRRRSARAPSRPRPTSAPSTVEDATRVVERHVPRGALPRRPAARRPSARTSSVNARSPDGPREPVATRRASPSTRS